MPEDLLPQSPPVICFVRAQEYKDPDFDFGLTIERTTNNETVMRLTDTTGDFTEIVFNVFGDVVASLKKFNLFTPSPDVQPAKDPSPKDRRTDDDVAVLVDVVASAMQSDTPSDAAGGVPLRAVTKFAGLIREEFWWAGKLSADDRHTSLRRTCSAMTERGLPVDELVERALVISFKNAVEGEVGKVGSTVDAEVVDALAHYVASHATDWSPRPHHPGIWVCRFTRGDVMWALAQEFADNERVAAEPCVSPEFDWHLVAGMDTGEKT